MYIISRVQIPIADISRALSWTTQQNSIGEGRNGRGLNLAGAVGNEGEVFSYVVMAVDQDFMWWSEDACLWRTFSLVGLQVAFASDCIGEEVQKGLSGLKSGEVGSPSL